MTDFQSKFFRPHYNLNLQSIAVSGQPLPIDSAAFETSNNRGTIVDSGTTLAYLVEEAYDPFVSAVSAFVCLFSSMKCYGTTLVHLEDDNWFLKI